MSPDWVCKKFQMSSGILLTTWWWWYQTRCQPWWWWYQTRCQHFQTNLGGYDFIFHPDGMTSRMTSRHFVYFIYTLIIYIIEYFFIDCHFSQEFQSRLNFMPIYLDGILSDESQELTLIHAYWHLDWTFIQSKFPLDYLDWHSCGLCVIADCWNDNWNETWTGIFLLGGHSLFSQDHRLDVHPEITCELKFLSNFQLHFLVWRS